MKYLILVLLLISGCAKLVPDHVEVEHTVNIQAIQPYITAYCQDTVPSDQVVECVNYHIGKLLAGI